MLVAVQERVLELLADEEAATYEEWQFQIISSSRPELNGAGLLDIDGLLRTEVCFVESVFSIQFQCQVIYSCVGR